MNEIGDIIKKWRFKNNLTGEEAASMIEVSQQFLNGIENGKKKLSKKVFEKLFNIMDKESQKELEYNFYIKDLPQNVLSLLTGTQEQIDVIPQIEIPIYSSASAGFGHIADSEPIGHTFYSKTSGEIIGIKVNGNSMEPTFKSGQNIIVKKDIEVTPGEIGVFLHKVTGECYVKRLKHKNGKFILSSDNSDYEDKEVLSENIVCCGKVIGVTNYDLKKKKEDSLHSLIDELSIEKRLLAEKLLKTLLED